MTELELAVVEAMWRAKHGADADFSKAPAANKTVYEVLMRAAIEAYENVKALDAWKADMREQAAKSRFGKMAPEKEETLRDDPSGGFAHLNSAEMVSSSFDVEQTVTGNTKKPKRQQRGGL